jgi:hypothetical protein
VLLLQFRSATCALHSLRTILTRLQFGSLLSYQTESGQPPNTFDIDMSEWDQWMKWDASADGLPVMDPMSSGENDNAATTTKWQNGLMRQPSDVSFDDVLVDDTPLEFDGPCLSPTEGFPFESSSSPDSIYVDQPTDERRGSYFGFSTLSLAEQRNLQDIAMPYLMHPAEIMPEQEDAAALSSSSSSSSPKPKVKAPSKKRKSSAASKPDAGELCQSRKRGHNAIEKKYRTNLNDKIVALRDCIPSPCTFLDGQIIKDESKDDEDSSKDASYKYGKAAVLTRAVEYITHLEETMTVLGVEADILKARVLAFEKLAMSRTLVMNNSNLSARPLNIESLDTIKAG